MIKRYDWFHAYGEVQFSEEEEGDWVSYEAHADELATLRKEIGRLRGFAEAMLIVARAQGMMKIAHHAEEALK